MAFASPTDPYTATDLAAILPEIWTPMFQKSYFDNLTILNWSVDLSRFVSGSGDKIHVPDIYTNRFTVQTQSTQAAGVVDDTQAPADNTLDIDTHAYIAYVMGDKDVRQIAFDRQLAEGYAQQFRKLLLKEVEDAIFALWSSVTTKTIGDTATSLSDYEIRTALEKLEAADTIGDVYDLDDAAFFIHPVVYWRQLSGIAKYYEHQISQFNLVKNGVLGASGLKKNYKGVLYNVPVFTTSRVVSGLQTYRNLLCTKEAFGFAIQTKGAGGMVRIQSDYLLQNLGTLVVADIIYGVAVLREEAAVLVNANTTAQTS